MSARIVKAPPYGLPRWYKPVLLSLVIEVFCLIALGGSVRLMNAGLACPDWPLCFGDVIPDYHPQVYLEFIHRAMAGLVAISTVVLTVTLLFFSRAPRGLKALAAVTTLLLMAQIIFGALTVLWALHANVVATHLGLGTAFFGLLYWQHLRLKREAAATPMVLGRWYPVLMVAVYAQLLLGGLVASHYAALACPDFPRCLGQWVPTWAGPVGIHVIHRFGAYTLSALVVTNFVLTRRFSRDPRLRRASAFMMGLVVVQVALGIANVLLRVPPIIGVAHLGTATGLLALAIRQTSTITRRA